MEVKLNLMMSLQQPTISSPMQKKIVALFNFLGGSFIIIVMVIDITSSDSPYEWVVNCIIQYLYSMHVFVLYGPMLYITTPQSRLEFLPWTQQLLMSDGIETKLKLTAYCLPPNKKVCIKEMVKLAIFLWKSFCLTEKS